MTPMHNKAVTRRPPAPFTGVVGHGSRAAGTLGASAGAALHHAGRPGRVATDSGIGARQIVPATSRPLPRMQ